MAQLGTPDGAALQKPLDKLSKVLMEVPMIRRSSAETSFWSEFDLNQYLRSESLQNGHATLLGFCRLSCFQMQAACNGKP